MQYDHKYGGQSSNLISTGDSACFHSGEIPFNDFTAIPCSGKKYHVVIVGAGPAGLACAKICAEAGVSVAVFEKRLVIGDKVCAGGITLHGLLTTHKNILQRIFSSQVIVTRRQRTEIKTEDALIATVSRRELGARMLIEAESAGADIFLGWQVKSIEQGVVTVISSNKSYLKEEEQQKELGFTFLVGADGANSFVRRQLGLRTSLFGLGLNYQLEGVSREKMEWHLDPKHFGSGYAWIFPHKRSCSVGAYCDCKAISAIALKESLNRWATKEGLVFTKQDEEPRLRAAMVNFDYQGVEFTVDNGLTLGCSRIFLAGDAAGLASGLTGEGIYSAVISGEYVGRRILHVETKSCSRAFNSVLRNHQRHTKVVLFARHTPSFALDIVSELTCLALRFGLISADAMELGG